MRGYYSRLCRGDSRKLTNFLLIFISIFNFCFGLVILSSFILKDEKLNISTEISKSIQQQSIQKSYQYYFRIDYTIIKIQCKSIYLFNTTKNIISIQNLTNSKLKTLLTRNLTIITDIISFKSILINEDTKTLCDYVLQLLIGFSFSSFCDQNCQLEQIQRLSSKTRPFGDPINDSFNLILYTIDSSKFEIIFNIHQMLFFKSSKYFDKSVYIRSYYENVYLFSLIINSKLSIIMSQNNRSLFLIKDGLYKNISSSISISFLSSFIQHQNGKIKLKKYIENNLFNKYSTFYLIFSKTKKDMIAFKSIHQKQFYISIDPITSKYLILDKVNNSKLDIYYFEKRFLFKFIYD